MELNFLKCDSIQTVQTIELKLAAYDVGHIVMHCADFGERCSIVCLQKQKG